MYCIVLYYIWIYAILYVDICYIIFGYMLYYMWIYAILYVDIWYITCGDMIFDMWRYVSMSPIEWRYLCNLPVPPRLSTVHPSHTWCPWLRFCHWKCGHAHMCTSLCYRMFLPTRRVWLWQHTVPACSVQLETENIFVIIYFLTICGYRY